MAKIKILYVHYGDNWIRGSEKCLLDLVSSLDKNKFEAIVWCNSPILQEQLQRRDIKTYRSEFTLLLGWKSPKFSITNFISLIREANTLIKENAIDVVHANSGAPMQWLVFSAKSCKIPLINHLHSPYVLRDRLSLLLHHASHTVGVSQAVCKELHDDLGRDDRLSVIYNGVDKLEHNAAASLDLRASLNIAKDSVLLASVGSLIERKGFDDCIYVLHQLIKSGQSSDLLIIGSGPEEKKLKELVVNLKLSSHVHFLGEIKNPFSILEDQVDIYITLPREEAFGLTLVEACLAKLPIVAKRVGGIPEVITSGVSGLLVDSVAEAASAIRRLVSEPEFKQALANNGQRDALDRFSLQRYCHEFECLYQRIWKDNTQVRLFDGVYSAIAKNRFIEKAKLFSLGINRVFQEAHRK